MNKIEFYRLQKEAGLTNSEAARLLGVTIRAITKWRIEKPAAPKAVIMVLESIVSNKPVKRD